MGLCTPKSAFFTTTFFSMFRRISPASTTFVLPITTSIWKNISVNTVVLNGIEPTVVGSPREFGAGDLLSSYLLSVVVNEVRANL